MSIMLILTKILIFVNLYVLVKCEIPDLNVQKINRTLIAKKRQDTRDMCRIFTEENAKTDNTMPKIIKSYNTIQTGQTKYRPKREVAMKYSVNPALKEEDINRVEGIVDKLYDDMGERGQNITYKKIKLPRKTTITVQTSNIVTNRPERRFFFAPDTLVSAPAPPEPMANYHPQDNKLFDETRWKDGIIPYFIDSKTYDAQLQETIMTAFDYIEKATCIRLQKLREKPTDKRSLTEVDWVYITNPTGIRQCVHSNEKRRIDGVQMSVLGYDCMSLGDIAHEVMHILGFSHEHTRSDRDQYISIFWDNIKPGYKKYFEIAKPGDQYTLEHLPYDYASVLHYPPRAFSKNGQLTVWTESGIKIGQREGLSEIDLEKVGTIYSEQCVKRNREYLLRTCPSVVKNDALKVRQHTPQRDIENYFKTRLWPYGVINYKLRDKMEFSTEEKENIKAVIRHIETETCIKFRDISIDEEADSYDSQKEDLNQNDEKTRNKPVISDDSDKDLTIEDFNINNMDQESAPEHNPQFIIDNEIYGEMREEKGISTTRKKREEISTTRKNSEEISTARKNSEEMSTTRKHSEEMSTTRKHSEEMSTTIKNNKINEEISTTRKDDKVARTKNRRRTINRPAKKSAKFAGRRHAGSVMVLTRSSEPGCKCPKPGRPHGTKEIEISADCFNSVNELLHLFVHVLGLDHQHNMHDRDDYLHIVWDNITPDVKQELQNKLPPAASVGFEYDYQSVTHYPWLEIKNGVTNIMYPIWNDGWAIGNWQGLSSVDVQKLNLLYFSLCLSRDE